jgi:hypothetical protein
MMHVSRVAPLLSSAFLVTALAGCAVAPKESEDAHAHTGDTTDVQSTREMHKKMMGGKPSEQQQAMMQDHMRSMTPEMRQRMQAMHDQCK